MLTSWTGPVGSSKDTLAMERSHGAICQTTNKCGLRPDNNRGRFTGETFSDATHDTLIDPEGNQFKVCKLSCCYLEDLDTVKAIISNSYTSPYSVVGGVIHPFNFAKNPIPFRAWVDGVSVRFSGQCETVIAVIQETDCNTEDVAVSEKNNFLSKDSFAVYPNPVLADFSLG